MDGSVWAIQPRDGAPLLEAAVSVVKRLGPEALTPAAVAAEAGMSAEDFGKYFPEATSFVLGLHQHYLDTLLNQLSGAIGTLPPGPTRLRLGVRRFLDISLRRARMRQALRRLMAGLPGAVAQIDHRHRAFTHLLAAEFAAMKRPQPVAAARLARAMIAEIAQAELNALQELSDLRAALWSYLEVDRRSE